MSPAEWGGNPVVGPDGESQVPAPSSWPSRIGGYAKLLWTAGTTLGTSGIIAWLQSAGATHLPPWVSAGITALIGIGTVLFSPKNKP